MNEIENVTEVTENVEQETTEELEGVELTDTATEETEVKEEQNGKYYTDEDIEEMVSRRVSRAVRKAVKEKDRELSKYRDTENVLKAGLGANDIDDANNKLREFYTNEGIELPERYNPGLDAEEIEILAEGKAKRIIDDGFEAMEDEANRLAQKGYQNMTEEEKKIFTTLADKLTYEKDRKALLKLGAKEEVLNDKAFADFRNQFNPNVPIEDIFALYTKSNAGSSKPANIGSMKSSAPDNSKEYFTPEEVTNLTDEDWAKPGVWEKARKSQLQWK